MTTTLQTESNCNKKTFPKNPRYLKNSTKYILSSNFIIFTQNDCSDFSQFSIGLKPKIFAR